MGDNKLKSNLILQYYKSRENDRQKELDDCLRYNLNNPGIDKVYLLISEKTTLPEDISKEKLELILFEKRPTYKDFFSYINKLYNNDIWIIANTDIYFTESISKVKDINLTNKILCLSRWNLPGFLLTENRAVDKFSLQYDPKDSHDVWIVGHPLDKETLEKLDFSLGIPGCDGKFCYVVQKQGYKTYNPCKEIISIHNHTTNKKTYSESQRIKTPYGQVAPCKIEDIK